MSVTGPTSGVTGLTPAETDDPTAIDSPPAPAADTPARPAAGTPGRPVIAGAVPGDGPDQATLDAVNAKLPPVTGRRFAVTADGSIAEPGVSSGPPAFDAEGCDRMYRAGEALVNAPQGVLGGLGEGTQQALLDGASALYDQAFQAAQGSTVMPEDALRMRSGTFATMLAVVEGADTPAVQQAAANALLDRALNEPDERLRAFMFRDMAALKDKLPADCQAKVDQLKSRVIPDSPPYDQWITPDHPTLEVREYAHPDCWKYGADPNPMYQAMGLTLKNHGKDAQGEEFWEYAGSLKDATGKNPPTPAHVIVYKSKDEFMRDMDDPNVNCVFYTGHSNLGGNVSEAVRRGPAENGTKLVHLGMCRGQQNMYEFVNKYPHAHLTTTENPHYFNNMQGVVRGTLEGIARRDSWQGIDDSTQVEGNNLIRPNQMRRYQFLDEDRDGIPDAGPGGGERFFHVEPHLPQPTTTDLVPRAEPRAAEDIDGSPVMDGVNFARTLLTYHVEDGDPGHSKLRGIPGDRLEANGWFDGDGTGEPVRIEEAQGTDGKPLYKVSIDKSLAGQSRYALGALVQYEAFKQFSTKNSPDGSFAPEDKARALLATGEYLSYMYCTQAEADSIMGAIGRTLGIDGLDYSTVRAAIDTDGHGYVTDGQVAALMQKVSIS